jgi:alpha-L-fucosidase
MTFDFQKHISKSEGLYSSRRDFVKLAAATGSLQFLPSKLLAAMSPNDRTAWYRNAKFGIFIHFGPYSLASVEASWPIMTPKPGGISEGEYVQLAKRFNPERFDAHAIVDLARSAGQKYIVFTTKHHDGFCMFDSSYTDYKITNTPYRKDIVQQLSSECQKTSMPLGFYYSPPDMHHAAFRDTSKPASTNWHGEPGRPKWSL